MNIIRILRCVAVFAFILSSKISDAQLCTSASVDMQKAQYLWFDTKNAAGIAHDSMTNYSNVKVGYDVEKGDFKRPQQGEADKNLSVKSEGFINLSKVMVWGKFTFRHENVEDASYNASITDPFRGMPYYVIDNYSDSKWRNQFYELQARMSVPVGNKIAVGLSGDYKASLAAKQRDPSVDTRFYTLRVIPSVTFDFNDHHRIGGHFNYTSVKEDSRMDNVYYYLYQFYWTHYGLGMSTQDYGYAGPTTNYIGDLLGGGLQYQFETNAWKVLMEAEYEKYVESAEQTYETPCKMFLVNDHTAKVKLSAIHSSDKFILVTKASYLYRHIDGIQYINQRDNTEAQQGWIDLHHDIRSTYDTRSVSFDYSIMRRRGQEYNWGIDASVNYVGYDDEYILPKSTKDSKNLFVEVAAKKNFVVGEKKSKRLLVALKGGIRNAVEGGYNYGGTHKDYPAVAMEMSDEAFLTSDAWHIGGGVNYSQQLRESKKTTVFFNVAFDHHKSKAETFSKRNFTSCTLGFNF